MKRALIIQILLCAAVLAVWAQAATADLYVMGRVYGTDTRVWQFDNAGAYVRDFPVIDDGSYNGSGAIAVTPGGSVLVGQGHVIVQYTATGQPAGTLATDVLAAFDDGTRYMHVDEGGAIYVAPWHQYPHSDDVEKYTAGGVYQSTYVGLAAAVGIFAETGGSVYAVDQDDNLKIWESGGTAPARTVGLGHDTYQTDLNCDDEEFYCLYGRTPSDNTIYVHDLDGALLRTISVDMPAYAYWLDYDPIRRHLFVGTSSAPGVIKELALDGTVLETYEMEDYGPIYVIGIASNIPEPATLALLALGGAAVLGRRRRLRGATGAMVPAIVVALLMAGAAQAAITYTVTSSGSYTVSIGTTTTVVDTYTVTYDAGASYTIGALVADMGLIAGAGGSDPFQGAWVEYTAKGYKTRLTPTQEAADTYLTPPDATKIYESDTHFLPAGIGTWPAAVLLPYESNDKSIYDPGDTADYAVGKGGLSVAIAVPLALRTQVMDVMRVGVIRGTQVWLHDQSADNMGRVTRAYIPIPEPATLALLVVGAGLWRRRRRRLKAA